MFTPALGNYGGYELSAFVSFFLSAIIVGYIFSQKIWEENRTKTIAKIAVLFTVLISVIVSIENASSSKTAMMKEDYLKAHTTPSEFDWYYIERLTLASEDFVVVVLVLAVSFIGLYIGSMLKKPAKT